MISDCIGVGVRGVSGGWNNVLMLESNKYSISQTRPLNLFPFTGASVITALVENFIQHVIGFVFK